MLARILSLLPLLLGAACAMGDECDWFGSGLSSEGRGVTPVYLRCAQGSVRWAYPRGALRVLLRAGASGRDFRGCLRLGASFEGARLFVEGPRSLLPLWGAEEAPPIGRHLCFPSRGAQAAIYVESLPAPSGDFTRRVADFTYDLEPLPRGRKSYDPAQECRPCTRDEMAQAFCTSDIVVHGSIKGIENSHESDMTKLQVNLKKWLREEVTSSDENNVVSDLMLHIPRRCGASHGVGEFVFMARRKLGDLTLTCAPRLEDWRTTVQRITEDGTAHCLLES